MAADNFGFVQALGKFKDLRRESLVLLSNQAQNYFVKSFTNQGFNGEGWKEVNRRIEDKPAYKYPKKKGLSRRTKPILIGSGDLRRQVAGMAKTAQITDDNLRMIVDLPYAARHNEGLKGMPKRQFIEQTSELTKMQNDKIKQILDKLWQR